MHAISLEAELQKVFQERFLNDTCTSNLSKQNQKKKKKCFNLLLVYLFILFVLIKIALFLEQVIRALISKGVGSASYTGSLLRIFFVCGKWKLFGEIDFARSSNII